jgi:hypothetical protein
MKSQEKLPFTASKDSGTVRGLYAALLPVSMAGYRQSCALQTPVR